jgi:hypothetical protein
MPRRVYSNAARRQRGGCGNLKVYRAKRNTPRLDDNTSVLTDSVRLLSPLSRLVYAFSKAIVGHAARVHANAGPAVKVCPDSANAPLQTLQSTRVESRPSANDNV